MQLPIQDSGSSRNAPLVPHDLILPNPRTKMPTMRCSQHVQQGTCMVSLGIMSIHTSSMFPPSDVVLNSISHTSARTYMTSKDNKRRARVEMEQFTGNSRTLLTAAETSTS